MPALRMLLAAFALCVGCSFTSAVNASSGTNFSDQWWNPNESGWGASVLQQADVLFIEIFVYGPDNLPTWYTTAAFFQPQAGLTIFSGDLYVSNGPWFGAFFNPAAVFRRKVGTLSSTPAAPTSQRLPIPSTTSSSSSRSSGCFGRMKISPAATTAVSSTTRADVSTRPAMDTSRSSVRSRSISPGTVRSRSHCNPASATARSPATTASLGTWERSMPTTHARTASTAL